MDERYLGESDWDDIDLITTDEAAFRFDEEIAQLQARLTGVEGGTEDPALDAARSRLDLLLDARERLSKPRTFFRSTEQPDASTRRAAP